MSILAHSTTGATPSQAPVFQNHPADRPYDARGACHVAKEPYTAGSLESEVPADRPFTGEDQPRTRSDVRGH